MGKDKNVGEWSELYALATILHQGGMHAGDKYGNINLEKFYKVIRAFIDKSENNSHRQYRILENTIQIFGHADLPLGEVSKSDISNLSSEFLSSLKQNRQTTFSGDAARRLISSLDVKRIKGPSSVKSDLDLTLQDEILGMETPRTGFSVKSYLKSRPTLINASQATNVNYKIIGEGVPKDLIPKDVMGNTRKILQQGFKLELLSLGNDKYSASMRYIDLNLPEYLARLLLRNYSLNGAVSLKKLAELEFSNEQYSDQISKKIKQFLAASAVSISPSKLWGGDLTGIGGMITVDRKGSVSCFYLYNMEDFEDFLFENTYFETASTTRYQQGSILNVNGQYVYRLNIQVRFI